MEKLTYSVPELAKSLGISASAAYKLVHTKGFPTLSLGKRKLVLIDELQSWLKQNSGWGN
ncbi:MAG: helix-turn-helix domain-containing protein [Bacillota bacterium]|nr:helix-turn-helix domain-containing protein [Bacillota bacterium]